MGATDPFLVRAIQDIRDFAQDTLDEVRWSQSKLLTLIDRANALVWEEILGSREPQTSIRYTEAPVTITAGQEDYLYPGTFRKFLRFVKKDADGSIIEEKMPVDPLSDLPGIVLFDKLRGYRITPRPTETETGWYLIYEPMPVPYLCYGPCGANENAGQVVLSSATLGSLSTTEDFYVGAMIRIVSGSHSVGVIRRVTDYSAGGIATVSPDWPSAPTTTEVFEVMPCVEYPWDCVIAWRAVMMMKAGDADAAHWRAAEAEYTRVMSAILRHVGDIQGRVGPMTGSSFMTAEDYGDILI